MSTPSEKELLAAWVIADPAERLVLERRIRRFRESRNPEDDHPYGAVRGGRGGGGSTEAKKAISSAKASATRAASRAPSRPPDPVDALANALVPVAHALRHGLPTDAVAAHAQHYLREMLDSGVRLDEFGSDYPHLLDAAHGALDAMPAS